MHMVVRTYSGAAAKRLFDLFEARKDEVNRVIGSVPGLISYAMARNEDGGVSVTICQDKAGIEASSRAARDWVLSNASDIGASPPTVTEGTVIVKI